MRLDKFIADSSANSRSDAAKLIRRGAVEVNGVRAVSPSEKVSEGDAVSLGGKRIVYRKYVYLMLNKPAGFLSATEDKRDPVVVSLLPEEYRHFNAFPVGRLDKDAEGLLLLTNDGAFDHAMSAPSRNVRKRYFAVLDAPAVPGDAEIFASGMDLGDFTAKPARLEITDDPRRVFIEVSEGKFHQVKRMCGHVGKNVEYLKRVAEGPIMLDESLAPGSVRELTENELKLLEAECAQGVKTPHIPRDSSGH